MRSYLTCKLQYQPLHNRKSCPATASANIPSAAHLAQYTVPAAIQSTCRAAPPDHHPHIIPISCSSLHVRKQYNPTSERNTVITRCSLREPRHLKACELPTSSSAAAHMAQSQVSTKSKFWQNFNSAGVGLFFQILGGDKKLAIPHVSVPDISKIDWAAVKAAGFKGCVFDKDNTLTEPYSLQAYLLSRWVLPAMLIENCVWKLYVPDSEEETQTRPKHTPPSTYISADWWSQLRHMVQVCGYPAAIRSFTVAVNQAAGCQPVAPHLQASLSTCQAVFDRRLVLYSNSAGLQQYDPDGEEAASLEKALGIPVLRHKDKKPAGGCEELESHFGCKAHELVMIGDRYLTDIVFGNRHGMLTIRPAPLTVQGEPAGVKLARNVEDFFLHRWTGSIAAPEHPLLKTLKVDKFVISKT